MLSTQSFQKIYFEIMKWNSRSSAKQKILSGFEEKDKLPTSIFWPCC